MLRDITQRFFGASTWRPASTSPLPSTQISNGPRDTSSVDLTHASTPVPSTATPANVRGHVRPPLVSAFTAFTSAPMATLGSMFTKMADAMKPGPSSDDVVAGLLEKNLSRWASTPGQLSQADIDKAVADPKVTGDDAAALAALADTYDDIAKANKGKFVTLKDIQGFELGKKFTDNQKTLKTASKAVFNGPLDYRALQQGDVGDCYYLSALDDEVRFHPDRVAGWASQGADGTTTITFPYRFVSPQKVSPPTETEICLHASSGANGTWGTNFETAWENGHYPGQGRKGEQGEDPVLGVQVVTGHDAIDEEIPTISLEDIHKTLTDAFKDPANPKIVEASTYDPPDPKDNGKLPDPNAKKANGDADDKRPDPSGPDTPKLTRTYTNGLVESHAYSLQGYDPKTRLVTLRNPWGSNPPVDAVKDLGNGEFTYTLAQLIDQFELLTVEQPDKPAPPPDAAPPTATDHSKKTPQHLKH